MAATRLIAMHQNKGKTIAKSLGERTDYDKNPEKTNKGELVTGYGCDPKTVDEEFLLQKRQYLHITGKQPKHDVIAYQIRQSFKPGEITEEEANRLGHELALRFTKGNYSFIVATHTDREHIHNHIVFNSTSMDGTRKFKNFFLSGRALQRLSDIVCLENGLSVITPKPYSEREKRTEYPERESARNILCKDIDRALRSIPKDYEHFLRMMEDFGYEIKRGKTVAFKGKNQKRFIRLSSLGDDYTESTIREIIGGKRNISSLPGKYDKNNGRIDLLIDVEKKLREKGAGYARWATVHNIKQMSKSLIILREHGIKSLEQLDDISGNIVKKRDQLLSEIQASEKRLVEIVTLKKHIVNYLKTKSVYEEYRKHGYSKKYYEAHREEITIHKTSKKAFEELRGQKIPKVKELSEEYARILSDKKRAYAEYRNIRDEAKDLLIAKQNIESLFEAERQEKKEKERELQER